MDSGLTQSQKWLLAGFIVLILAGGGMRLYLSSDAYNRKLAKESPLEVYNAPERKLLAVDVDGAVARPGVYRFVEGATRAEAVREAGGLAAGADTSGVNLAARVRDGEKVYIPGAGDAAAAAGDAAGAAPAVVVDDEGSATAPVVLKRAKGKSAGARAEKKQPKVVNINTADEAGLTALPGVGPSTAKKIVELRKLRGPFNTIEEIMLVKGIGQKKFEKMKNYLRVK